MSGWRAMPDEPMLHTRVVMRSRDAELAGAVLGMHCPGDVGVDVLYLGPFVLRSPPPESARRRYSEGW